MSPSRASASLHLRAQSRVSKPLHSTYVRDPSFSCTTKSIVYVHILCPFTYRCSGTCLSQLFMSLAFTRRSSSFAYDASNMEWYMFPPYSHVFEWYLFPRTCQYVIPTVYHRSVIHSEQLVHIDQRAARYILYTGRYYQPSKLRHEKTRSLRVHAHHRETWRSRYSKEVRQRPHARDRTKGMESRYRKKVS